MLSFFSLSKLLPFKALPVLVSISKISNPVTIYVETSPPPGGGACNQNFIKEAGEQCDFGPNGGFSNDCTTKRCQSNCQCDNLALNCQEDYELTKNCDSNSDAASRDLAQGNPNPSCQDAFYECKLIGGVCTVNSNFKDKNPLPGGCRPISGAGKDFVTCCSGGRVSSTSECKEGYRTITISYTSVDPSCGADVCPTTKTIPCGRNVAYLPFIGAWQIIGAVVIIGAIYYFIFLRKKEKKLEVVINVNFIV